MKEKTPPYTIVDNTIHIMMGNKLITGKATEYVKKKLAEGDWAAVYAHVTDKATVVRHDNALANIGVIDGKMSGREVPQVIHDKLTQLVENHVPIKPLGRMLDNLLNMPDNLQGKTKEQRIVDAFNFFCAHAEFPVTEDGAILAWKKVRDDLTSFVTNDRGEHLQYEIGGFTSLPEHEVDSNSNNRCSKGIHACARSYLPHFMGNTGKVIILKIFPQDIRACPTDYGCAKLRAVRVFTVDFADADTMKMAFDLGVHYEDPEQFDKDMLDEAELEDYNKFEAEAQNDLLANVPIEDEVRVKISKTLDPTSERILNAIQKYLDEGTPTTYRRISKNIGVTYDEIDYAISESNVSVNQDSASQGNWFLFA